jgi:non-homologous end joining protein Ku
MPKRSLWHGAISFGLIYVPIELYSASKEHALSLHFLDSRDFSVIKPAAIGSKSVKLKQAEVAMARKLVEEMSAAWDPQAFHDTYREDLMRRIREKIKKKETHILGSDPKKAPRPKAEVIDLMSALKKSLQLRAKQDLRAAPKSARERKRA